MVHANSLLITTQWGSQARPFYVLNGLEKMQAVKDLLKIIEELSSKVESIFALSYGTLLGAVRNGNLIPHDFDFDIAFFPKSLKIDDVETTAKRLIEEIKSMGLKIRVTSHGHFTTYIDVKNRQTNVDFFAGWISSGRVMHYFAINGEVSEEDYFPLGHGFICGLKAPVPRNSEVILAAIYGNSWRDPNSNFRHEPNFENFQFLFLRNSIKF